MRLETDHKTPVPLLGQKSLSSLPPRIFRFRLRLLHFQYSIYHSPGKSLYLADTLLRAPVPLDASGHVVVEVEKFVDAVVQSLPANEDCLETYRRAQMEDPECAQVVEYCHTEWPTKHKIKRALKPFWSTFDNK